MLLKIKDSTIDSEHLNDVGIRYGLNGLCTIIGCEDSNIHTLLETINEEEAKNLINEINQGGM